MSKQTNLFDRAAHVGFTGTQRGMTEVQKLQVRHTLATLTNIPFVARHGDCVGADSDFHDIVATRYAVCSGILIHAPLCTSRRAFCDLRRSQIPVHVLPPRHYIERNHDIVDASDFMIATPGGREEQLRSGTWATIRYARRRGVPLRIIYPDGTGEDSWNRC